MSYIVSNIHLLFLFVCFCFVGFLFCWFFCGCFLGTAVVSLLCYVKGGDYGGHNTNTGYGSRYGGRSVRPISVIYPSLYQTQWSSLPYQYPTSYYSPPVSNPSYPQYYPSYYHSHHTHNLDPFLFSTPSSGFGGGIFNSGWIPLIVMCKYTFFLFY